jgi:isoleucyl-tRNA synthetase
MLFMSVTLEDKTPYLEVLSYEKLYDERGAPMHKSAGNAIWFDDAAEKMGVDVMRWMYLMQKPELNLNFGYKVADETRRKFHLLLWNVYNFFVSYANIGKFQPLNFQSQIQKSKNVLDRWLISRLNNLVKVVTESLDRFDAFTASHQIQGFVEDLSTWYIRRSRDRVSPVGKNEQDQEICFRTLYSVLVTLAKLLAPFNPFMAEEICRNLTEKQSVHLEDWPKADEDLVDEVLEEKMRLVRKICEAGHAKRKELGIKVRQPLKRAKCKGQRAKLDEELVQLIKDELNVKAVIWEKEKIGEPKVEFDTKITQELKEEGEARELIRQIQEARKLAGCRLDEQIEVVAPSWPKKFEEEIKRETLTTGFTSGEKLKIRRRH